MTKPNSFRNIEKRFGKLIKKYQRTKIIALVGLMQDARISKTMLMSYSNLEELENQRRNSIVSTKQGEFLSRKIKSKASFPKLVVITPNYQYHLGHIYDISKNKIPN